MLPIWQIADINADQSARKGAFLRVALPRRPARPVTEKPKWQRRK